jgi:hypothetical protein
MTELTTAQRRQFTSFSATPRSRVDIHGFDRNVFFGRPDFDGPGPQAYVNELDSGVELAAHFHKVDQYQVFFGSPGAVYKRRSVPPVLLHYTDAYSTYGPFGAGPANTFKYATLRARSSNYGGVMPGARSELIHRGGLRNLTVEVAIEEPEPTPDASITPVIEPHPDGLASWLVVLGPDSGTNVRPSAQTAGRYTCVLSGDLIVEGKHFEPLSLGWNPPEDTGLAFTAGPHGCRALVMDFPAYGDPD